MTIKSNQRGRKRLSHCKTLDRFSDLPENVIQNVIMFLPIRDAVRTSILSKTWRHRWADVPEIVFDDAFFNDIENSIGVELLMQTIFEVLLLHSGPILKFTYSISERSCPEIDRMILFLSRKGVQDLNLHISGFDHDYYKLPSTIFSCLQLRCLNLSSCIFKTPPMFKGFSRLISLEFKNVQFDTNALQKFISNCPLLERLLLDGCTEIFDLEINSPTLKFLSYSGYYRSIRFENAPLLATVSILGGAYVRVTSKVFSLIDVFSNLPVVEYLTVDYPFLKAIARCDASEKLPTILNDLKALELYGLNFADWDQVSCVLCLLRNSPNLQILRIELDSNDKKYHLLVPAELEKHLDFSLDQLQEVTLQFLTGARHQVEFVKCLLAKSSALKTMRIEMDTNEELKVLKEIIQFKRASPNAEIICID